MEIPEIIKQAAVFINTILTFIIIYLIKTVITLEKKIAVLENELTHLITIIRELKEKVE